MTRAAFLLPLLLALAYGCGQPENPSWAVNWARTPISYGNYRVTFGTTKPYVVRDSTGTSWTNPITSNVTTGVPVLFALPAQVRIAPTTEAGQVTACFSMALTATVTAPGFFAADADTGAVATTAGHGPCLSVEGPIPDFLAVSEGYFRQGFHGGSWPPGAKRYKCASTEEPCSVDTNCSTGTCGTATGERPNRAYLLVQSAEGAGFVDVMDAR